MDTISIFVLVPGMLHSGKHPTQHQALSSHRTSSFWTASSARRAREALTFLFNRAHDICILATTCIFTQDFRTLTYCDRCFHRSSLLARVEQAQSIRDRMRSSNATSRHSRNHLHATERYRKRSTASDVSVYLTQLSKTRSRTPSETRRIRCRSSSSRAARLSWAFLKRAPKTFSFRRLDNRWVNAFTRRAVVIVVRQTTKL